MHSYKTICKQDFVKMNAGIYADRVPIFFGLFFLDPTNIQICKTCLSHADISYIIARV